jgi:outer membrane receptor protein involved in Fe transport
VYPRFAVSWYAREWLALFARFEPDIQRTTLSEYLDESPYIVNDVRIRHVEHPLNFSLGTRVDLAQSTTATFTFTYRQSHNQPLYVDTAGAHVWTTTYMGTTRTLSFEGEMFADITHADHIGASLLVRGSRNSQTRKAIPYLPASMLSGLYQHRFPFGLLLGTTIRLVGRRFADLDATRVLGSFLSIGFTAEYALIPHLTGAFTLDNVLNQNQVWWENYPAGPRAAALALGYTW